MNHDKHDKKLRAKFQSYSPRVDESALWEGIESALPQPKRKNRFIFLFMFFGLMVSASVFVFFKIYTISNDLAQSKIETKSIVKGESKPTASKYILNTTTEIQPTKNKNEKLTQNAITQKQSTLLKNKETKLPIQVSEYFKYKLENTNIKESHTPNTVLQHDRPSRSIRNHMQPVNQLPYNIVAPQLELKKYKHNFILRPSIKSEAILEPSFTLNFTTSAGKAISRHSFTPPSTETGAEAIGAEVYVNYRFAKKWNIGIGLSYQNHMSSAMVNSFSSSTSTRTDTTAIIQTASNIEIVEGPTEFLTTTKQIHLRHQRTQQLLAPISLMYDSPLSKDWRIQVGLGYAISLGTSYQGIIQDPMDIAYDLSTDIDSRLRLRGADRLFARTYLTRNITSFGRLRLGIIYQHDLQGRSIQNDITQKKSHLLQLSGGLIIPLHI